MAAIPYPDPDQVLGLAEVYAGIEAMGRPVLNLYRSMAHSPEGLRAYIGLSHFVRDNSSLPAPLRELAILQTGVSIGCEYQVEQHTIAARRAGVAEDKIQAVLQGRGEGFDAPELAVLAYACEVAASRSLSDETLASLREHLSLRQISDLALTVGMYHLCAAVLLPLRVELDA
ncbi:MAG TPA: carboxymuconolactone decarboxylase family protein [Chloroflexota bacterium]